jgi:hypothetical protein
LIDEGHYLVEEELRSVTLAMHAVAQQNGPVILGGAGRSPLAALAGDAKSDAERLVDDPDVGPLDPGSASSATAEPIRAAALGIPVQQAGILRNGLIKKGMIWGPAHGQTAFTVPMFDAFMKRAIPEWEPAHQT